MPFESIGLEIRQNSSYGDKVSFDSENKTKPNFGGPHPRSSPPRVRYIQTERYGRLHWSKHTEWFVASFKYRMGWILRRQRGRRVRGRRLSQSHGQALSASMGLRTACRCDLTRNVYIWSLFPFPGTELLKPCSVLSGKSTRNISWYSIRFLCPVPEIAQIPTDGKSVFYYSTTAEFMLMR